MLYGQLSILDLYSQQEIRNFYNGVKEVISFNELIGSLKS